MYSANFQEDRRGGFSIRQPPPTSLAIFQGVVDDASIGLAGQSRCRTLYAWQRQAIAVYSFPYGILNLYPMRHNLPHTQCCPEPFDVLVAHSRAGGKKATEDGTKVEVALDGVVVFAQGLKEDGEVF